MGFAAMVDGESHSLQACNWMKWDLAANLEAVFLQDTLAIGGKYGWKRTKWPQWST